MSENKMKEEIYISTDVEADGPIPGPNSMLSFASVAYTKDKKIIATFEANLHTLDDATGHPDTMKWWKTQQEAWVFCRSNLQTPATAMNNYFTWLRKLPGSPVFVGYPVSYDFMFVYWYLMKFVGECPFSHSALDIKTLAMASLKIPYRKISKKTMPISWFDDLPHTHKALDDAIEQGALFCNILSEITKRDRNGSEKSSTAMEAKKANIVIVSGGQTGVDRAALDAALEHNISCGGWCPEGRTAEDGVLSEKYPLLELQGAGYRQRTKKNVVDSDGTVIIYFKSLSGGTQLTLKFCINEHKPYLLIDATELTEKNAANRVTSFVQDYDIKKINFAGPRGSGEPEAYSYTRQVVSHFIQT